MRRAVKPKSAKREWIGSTVITSSVKPSMHNWLRSTITTRLPSWKWPADIAASHTWPSHSSPSPIMHQARWVASVELDFIW